MKQKQPNHDDAQTLFSIGQSHLFSEEYQEACDCFQKVCQMEPTNTEYLDLYAVALMEIGDTEEAQRVLKMLVELAPDEGHEKYLYLGQLLQGEEAIAAYNKGIQILQHELDDALHQQSIPQKQVPDEDAPSVADWQRALMAALCALAEHHLTVQEGSVEAVAGEVEHLASRAAAVMPGAAEPVQVMATLRHLQGRPEEALQLLRDSVRLWLKPVPQQEGSEEQDATASTAPEVDAENAAAAWPPLGARISAVRLLLELDETTDMALQVCETCLLEDEDSLEATYLLALAQYSGGALEEAETSLDDARIMAHEQGLPEAHPLHAQLQELGQAIEESKANVAGS